MDFRNLKATDLKNNKRVILPEPDDDTEEIRRKNLKSELKNIVIKYRNEHCDKSGNIINNNLDKNQLKDIKDLKKRMKKEGLAAGETDKTGKLTLDTLENVKEKLRNILTVGKFLGRIHDQQNKMVCLSQGSVSASMYWTL